MSGSGGPSTYVAGFVRALLERRTDIELRVLLLGLRQAGARGAQERRDVAQLLGPSGRVSVVGRPVSARLHGSRWSSLLPTYDSLFGRHDIYHQTHLDLDPPVPGDRLVLTLHDLVAEHWPDEGSLLPAADRLLTRSAAVVTVSAASRNDILNRFPAVDPSRVHVIWNGVDHALFNDREDEQDDAVLRTLGVGRPFLLYAGGLTLRKNVSNLLQAHRELHAGRDEAPALVLVGPWAPGLAVEAHPGVVVPLGNVPRSAVPALMRRAAVVVVPSREEGFGLPVLEAQACGALVVCSDIPAFREVAGEAPIYVDSSSSEALANGLCAALDLDPIDHARRTRTGIAHAAGYSWERSAAGHARVYESVLSSRV